MDPIFEKNLIPTKEASELSGYTSDYLARLARSGKISARRVGHTWFVDSESLKSFLDQQGDRKIDYARALARAREKEYRARHAPLQQVTSTLTKPIQMPEKLDSVVRALRSHVLAVSLSLAVIVSGALVANVAAISPLANQAATIAHDVAYGFDETFGDIPSRVALRIAAMRNVMSAISSRVASPTVSTSAHSALPFADLNLSSLQMKIDDTYRASRVAFFSNPISAPIERDTIRSAARDAYALITHPSRIADSFMYAYVAIGADTYAAIAASLSGYRSLIEESGIQSLALASAARDALRAAPNLVARMNLAFGAAIIGASHAAIRADTMVAYGLAEAAPRSARATVAFLGETGDLLARSATRVPALATALFLRVTRAPAHIAPALAAAVFNAEYTVSARFVKDTQALSKGYLGALTATGRLAYEGTSGTIALARTAISLIAKTPGAIEDAYLAALGRGALALDSLARVPQAAAALHTLSVGERIALAIYETVRNFFDATRRALAFLFGSPPKIAISPPEIIATTSATSAAPARVVAVNNYPTYTTIVRGVSEDFMNQSLASLRTNVLATVAGMIQPISRQVVNNSTTIQQVNMIQDLSNLIVRNGDFRGSIFDSGIRVTATDGNFTNLTGGTTSLGATTITGALTTTGALSSDTSATAPYFTATSTTATSTFAGSLAIDTNGFVYATSTKNVGIGVLSPAALLAIQNSTSTQPIFVASNAAGAEVYRITNVGFVGIGTSSPTYALSVEGSSSLGNQAIAGYFTATSSAATSTFTGGLTIGGTGFVYQQATKNLGIGTTSPDALLSLLQSANGTPMISAYRITDTAPTGDFINYKSNAGTTLFRVDNSGNLLAGGIVNSGSQTITSVSTPQFRVQYDSSNEWTTSINSTGTTTFAVNGSSPALAFTPQSNSTNTFRFTNAASTAILSVDTLNQRIGIGTTSPYAKLSVEGASALGNSATAGYFTATTSAASTFPYASTTALTISGTNGLQLAAALSGPLHANAGLVSATTSVLAQYGGTGQTSYTIGDFLYASATNLLSRLGIGTGGFVLGSVNGVPGWVATTTFSSGLSYSNGNVTNTGVTSIVAGTNVTISGATGAVTINSTGSGGSGTVSTSTNEISGYLPRWTSTSGTPALLGNSAVFQSGNNIGIGTTTPNWLLQVAGTRPSLALSDTSAGANLKHWLFSSMGGNLYIGTSTDAYATSTPAALTISNAGNVGIGTSTPGTLLSINNSANFVAGATSTIYNGLSTPYLNVTGTAATSTFANGISISGGCLLIGGTCFNGASGVTLTATRVYTSNTTWTAPSNLSYIVVKVVGGGAGSSSTGVKGGAAGGYCEKAVNASTITSPVTVTIGAGGAYSGTGGNGETSSFGSLCSATGGTGGAKGTGGIGSGGDINARGQRGSYTEDGTSSLLGFEYGGGGDAITGSGAGFPGVVIVEEYTTGAANSGSVGSGTQGQLAFYNAAGSNLTATSSIFLATSGNIGIGTTTPYSRLSVWGADTGANIMANFVNSASTSVMSILNNGNVGIGTTAPGATLDVVNTSGDAITVRKFAASATQPPAIAGYFGRGSLATPSIVQNGDLLFRLQAVGYNGSGSGANEAAAIKFEIDGTPGVADMPGRIKFATTPDGSDAAVDRLTILNSGNVGIGTTTPQVKLSVSGTSAILRISGDTTGNANTGYISFTDVNGVSKGYVGDGSGSNSTIYLSSGAGDIGIGGTGGDCTLTGAASGGTCFSDSRLKNIQGEITNVLGGLASIQLKTFYWNNLAHEVTNASTTILNRGFISQEVEQVFPELVYTDESGYKRLDYGSLGLYAIQGIKELNARTNFISNAATSTVLTVDVAGNVGIGTTTPNHMLTVAGDVGAIGFVNTSTRHLKTDIEYATASSTEAMLNQLVNLKVATYRYTIEDASDPLRLGFIAEEAQQVAPEILSADGKGVDLYKLATFNLAATQALAAKFDAMDSRVTSLEARVTALESGAISVSTTSPLSLSTTSLASAFEGLGVLIQKGIAQFNTLVFRTLVASKDEDGTSSAGSVSILTGNTVAQVNNSLVTPSTKIFVTFNSQITGSWWVSDKLAGSFRVVLSEAQAGDVSFDYFLVQTEGQLATSSPMTNVQGSVANDTTPPVITLLGDNPVHVSVGGVFVDPGITVVDDVDSAPTYTTFVNGIEQPVSSIDTGVQTTYIITYSATDQRGNFATATRSVIVGSTPLTTDGGSSSTTTATSTDTTAPVVTLVGAAAMEIAVGDAFTDQGATATDDIDGDLTAAIVVTGTVDTATAGLYTITYTAADAAGNSASVSRVVTVTVAATSTPAT